MMKRLITVLALILAFSFLTAFSASAQAEPDSGVDYSDPENWAYYGIGDGKEADLFLICPTVDMKDEYNMSLDDADVKKLVMR